MAILETHALTIGYAAGRKPPRVVARDIHETLHAGELVCLLGPNGAGKSTLLRTVAGVQSPLAGRVLLDGVDLHTLKPREIAARVAVVLTDRIDTGVMSGYELVALGRHPHTGWGGGLRDEDHAAVQRAIDAVGAGDIAALPVAHLSDGQRQKLMIARALAQDTPLLLLDEPTAFLDLPRRVEIMHLLRALTRASGRAALLSTHDLDLALRTADRVWLMTPQGTLVTGAPEDLVLSGAFAAAFAAEGAHFDAVSGAFRMTAVPRGLVSVRGGDALTQAWTRHALERAGWACPPDSAPASLDVEISGLPARWTLETWHGTSQYPTLYALISALHPLEQREANAHDSLADSPR